MKTYVTYGAGGEILRSGSCADADLPLQEVGAGEAVLEGDGRSSTHYVSGGLLVAYTAQQAEAKAARPSLTHTWSNDTMSWVRTVSLEGAKSAKLAEITAARLRANRSSFTFGGKQIAVDELSRSDVDAVSAEVGMTGALPSSFPGAWKAMDNTYVAIPDVATWVTFHSAMVAQGTANFVRSQALKSMVAAALTVEEVDAITWETAI